MPRAPIPLSAPARPICSGDPEYPEGLADLPDPPASLWLAGRLPLLPRVAIVGTRAASLPGLELAHDLAAELACHGVAIVSGGARGIDSAAHRGALSVSGATVAVLATGLVHAYPPENADLFADVAADGGALVSEVEGSVAAHRGRFLRRNRLVAALADAVVVVQAPARSGAMSTARWAKRLKRKLFSVPGDVWDPRFEGSNGLLREGANICTSVRDVLSVRPSLAPADSHGAAGRAGIRNEIQVLDGCCAAVFEQLRAGVRDPDRIAVELDIRINRVHECLLSLELMGVIHRTIEGGFGLASPAK